MKKILLLIIASFAFLSGLPAQITREEADEIVLKRVALDECPRIQTYTKEDVQAEMTVTTPTGKILELDYPCWVYFARYVRLNNAGRYLIVNESNGNLLEVNTMEDVVSLVNWRIISEKIYDTYENHDVSACGVNDPLQNIEWLREYCREVKEKEDIGVSIWLYKVIDKDEYIFDIYVSSGSHYRHPFEVSTSEKRLNCNGDIIEILFEGGTTVDYSPAPTITNVPPQPPNPWFEDKEVVGELFRFVKKI